MSLYRESPTIYKSRSDTPVISTKRFSKEELKKSYKRPTCKLESMCRRFPSYFTFNWWHTWILSVKYVFKCSYKDAKGESRCQKRHFFRFKRDHKVLLCVVKWGILWIRIIADSSKDAVLSNQYIWHNLHVCLIHVRVT